MTLPGMLCALAALTSLPLLARAQAAGENCDPRRSLHGACGADVDTSLACYKRQGYSQCAPAKAEKAACSHSRECDVGLYCAEQECREASSMKDPCATRFWACGKTGWCNPDRLVCVPFRVGGDSCSAFYECESNLTCIGGTCVPRSKSGGLCGGDHDCISGTFCNAEEELCQVPGGVGDDCAGPLQCKGSLECSAEGACEKRAVATTEPPTTTKKKKAAEKEKDDDLDPLDFPGGEAEADKDEESTGFWNWRKVVGMAAGGVLLLLLVLILIWCCMRRRQDKAYTEQFAGRSGAFSTFSDA